MRVPDYIVDDVVYFLDTSTQEKQYWEGVYKRCQRQKVEAEKKLDELKQKEEDTLSFIERNKLEDLIDKKLEEKRQKKHEEKINSDLKDTERLTKLAGLREEKIGDRNVETSN